MGVTAVANQLILHISDCAFHYVKKLSILIGAKLYFTIISAKFFE